MIPFPLADPVGAPAAVRARADKGRESLRNVRPDNLRGFGNSHMHRIMYDGIRMYILYMESQCI